MRITGTARNFDISQPSLIGTFFGNTVFQFVLVVDQEVSLPTGPTTFVPVRLECFLRSPSFDGLRLEVDGEFDSFDSLLRAKMVTVKETGMMVGGAKRLGFFAAIISLVIIVLMQLASFAISATLLGSGLASQSWPLIVAGIGCYVAATMMLGLVVMYLSRVAFPTLYESFDRLLRRYTEYRAN